MRLSRIKGEHQNWFAVILHSPLAHKFYLMVLVLVLVLELLLQLLSSNIRGAAGSRVLAERFSSILLETREQFINCDIGFRFEMHILITRRSNHK